MGPSRALVRAGLRTPARPGWRAAAGQSLATVLATPALWLLGALGFLLRGGALVLVVPVVVLPTPVALRLMVGDNLTSSGLAPGFYGLVLAIAVVVVAVLLACLVVVANVEVAAFARLTARQPASRRNAVAGVFAIQLFALATLVAAALPLVAGAVSVTHAELLRPTLGAPLYDRILGQLGGPLYFLLAVLVAVEAASAVATRRLLTGAFGLQRPVGSPLTAMLVGLGRPVLRPLTTLGTALVGWFASLALLVPALWALSLAWGSARGALLAGQSPVGLSGGEEVGALVAVLLLCGVWLGALALAGLASAVRAALWTAEEMR